MIQTAIDRIRNASPAFWRGVVVLGVAFVVLYSLAAQARDPTGKYANSPNAEWFRTQHNQIGQWCCDEADGHEYDGPYQFQKDGSVAVEPNGKKHTLGKEMVLNGPNPTGHAIWWFLDVNGDHFDYCFAPGTLS